jgi:hypothetical protein
MAEVAAPQLVQLETAMPWSSEVQQRIGKQAQAETE